jgi:hypothetical protein
MTTVVSILMSDIVPLRDRGLWQGIINIIYATGSGVGAPLGMFIIEIGKETLLLMFLGGILADSIGWRW